MISTKLGSAQRAPPQTGLFCCLTVPISRCPRDPPGVHRRVLCRTPGATPQPSYEGV